MSCYYPPEDLEIEPSDAAIQAARGQVGMLKNKKEAGPRKKAVRTALENEEAEILGRLASAKNKAVCFYVCDVLAKCGCLSDPSETPKRYEQNRWETCNKMPKIDQVLSWVREKLNVSGR